MTDRKSAPVKKPDLRLLLEVFWTTFKIGCVTFGGGQAMICVIQSEFSEKRNWVPAEEICDITAAAQTLPGIVALNASVLTAYRLGGTWPAVMAGLGVILPSMITLMIVTVFYSLFVDNPYVRGFLRGISGAVIALFINTLYKLYRTNLADIYAVGFFVVAAALIFIFPALNVIYIILGGALLGFVVYYLILKKRRTVEDA